MIELGISALLVLAVIEVIFWGFTIGMLRKVWHKVKQ
tara:strand:+ start:322 stop:432 length:111 start_codon:yes stop_codon:yes gene_type:complete